MKKLLSFLLSVLLIGCAVALPAGGLAEALNFEQHDATSPDEDHVHANASDLNAADNATQTLCMISDLELDPSISFLSDYDIEVPVGFDSLESAAKFALEVVERATKDFDFSCPYNSPHLVQFHGSVLDATIDYYGLADEYNSVQSIIPLEEYELKDSATIGVWKGIYKFYNGYAYALNQTSGLYIYPGYYSGVGSSEFGTAISAGKISQIVEWVKNDLQTSGYNYKCIKSSTALASVSSLSSSHTLICIRLGTNSTTGIKDFHLMRYIASSGTWRHKPGDTAILRYLYTPTYGKAWTNEYSENNVAGPGNTTYNGTLHFIAFAKSHAWIYASEYNAATHKMKCSSCGEIEYQAHVANSSNTACKICGRSTPFATVNTITPMLPIETNKKNKTEVIYE